MIFQFQQFQLNIVFKLSCHLHKSVLLYGSNKRKGKKTYNLCTYVLILTLFGLSIGRLLLVQTGISFPAERYLSTIFHRKYETKNNWMVENFQPIISNISCSKSKGTNCYILIYYINSFWFSFTKLCINFINVYLFYIKIMDVLNFKTKSNAVSVLRIEY